MIDQPAIAAPPPGPSPKIEPRWIAARLLVEQPYLTPEMNCEQVAALFVTQPAIHAFAVVDGDGPVGLVDRNSFLSRFATRFGRSLFERRSIRRLMDPRPLLVEATLSLTLVNLLITKTKPRALHAGFIIVNEGRYVGVGNGIGLMRQLADQMAEVNQNLSQTQADLVQAEKLAALGGLVAGIAHEINTPVGTALTAMTTLNEHLATFTALVDSGRIKKKDIDRFTGAVEQASVFLVGNLTRAAELIQSFKAIAVDQASDNRRRFPLQSTIEETVISLGPRLKKTGHRLTVDCPAELVLDSYPGALSQILTNLVMNSMIHGFPDGAQGAIGIAASAAGSDGVSLVFSDDGVGIPAETQLRIFDPFFTTRRGEGCTGLGLHIVYNLVTRRLGGRIEVDSTPGRGTRFLLTLPWAAPVGSQPDRQRPVLSGP